MRQDNLVRKIDQDMINRNGGGMGSKNFPTLAMLIGLPGTGKSTYRKILQKEMDNPVICSSDDHIERVAREQNKTYNEVFANNVKAGNKWAEDMAKYAIANKRDCIWDQTNLSYFSRKNKLSLFPRDKYYMVAHVFYPPDTMEEHMNIIRSREGKFIPENVIATMLGTFQFPFTSEFDEVIEHRIFASSNLEIN